MRVYEHTVAKTRKKSVSKAREFPSFNRERFMKCSEVQLQVRICARNGTWNR